MRYVFPVPAEIVLVSLVPASHPECTIELKAITNMTVQKMKERKRKRGGNRRERSGRIRKMRRRREQGGR